jgi:hypothetical protein
MQSNERAVMLIRAPDVNTKFAEISPEIEHGNWSSSKDCAPIRTEPSEMAPTQSGARTEHSLLKKTSSADWQNP